MDDGKLQMPHSRRRHDTKELSRFITRTHVSMTMHTTISQILYPNRQAFFEKLALSLPSQPAIKIGPAPLPSGVRRAGSRHLRRAVPTQRLCTAQRGMRVPKPLLRLQLAMS
jgi:hypothetical protein